MPFKTAISNGREIDNQREIASYARYSFRIKASPLLQRTCFKERLSFETMVNLIVRHQADSTGALPDMGVGRMKSPTSSTGRGLPVSPLTQTESMFGNRTDPYQSLNRREEREPASTFVPTGNDEEMICDYDLSVTELYEMLEASQWNSVCSRCQTHPEEVQTWVVRRNADGEIRWKLLPLHAAVIFKAPLALIEDLLTVYPNGAAQQDDQGLLPLHLAFRHSSDEVVIERLLRQYPQGVMVKDERERRPLEHGKEIQVSAKLMGVYARTYAKCQESGIREFVNEEDLKEKYEQRMKSLRDAFEARIFQWQNENAQIQETLRIQTEVDLRSIKERHAGEIAELRDQLAREKIIGEAVPELEAEVRRLSTSLRDTTSELSTLRSLVHEQNEQKEQMLEEMRQILSDQRTVQDRCKKQKEQLDQAQKLREQLVRTIIQKEDGMAVQASKDICQLSDNNIARTEKLLKKLSVGGLENNKPRRNSHLSAYQYEEREDLGNDYESHGDDVSEITDSSYVRPFAER